MTEAPLSARHRPRRSCLYMPADRPAVLEKGKTLDADCLIFDLEDAVSPAAKAEARGHAAAAVSGVGYGHRELVIRINGLDTEWGLDDLQAAVAAGPDAILAPKVVDGGDIDRLDDAMSRAGAPDSMALWVMIEMPKALLNIQSIAEGAGRTRLAAFVMGSNDLAKELRAQQTPGRPAFAYAFGVTLAAARAYDLLAIDGVLNQIGDDEALRRQCRDGCTLGFDGKTLIHPSQIAVANDVFRPEDEAVSHAEAVIAAFDDPGNSGKGVLKVNGEMTELLHLEEARRVVEMNKAIRRVQTR